MILCMTIDGLIPLRSAIVHPIALLFSFKTSNNACSWANSKLEAIMTGKVSLSPKNTYFKWLGKSLSSNFGGSSSGGLVPESISTGRPSNWWVHGGLPSFNAIASCASSSTRSA
ncbi:hypothetical protein HanPI659440_Chr07g0259091 [Helianthus annuus]|nr:hypothetical protein HanPI659440_Chr07g0259091 [Helianthus annuus]